MKTEKEIKIKTPYGVKNWSFVKRCFDSHNDLLEALELITQHGYDDDADVADICADFDHMKEIAHEAIKKAEA